MKERERKKRIFRYKWTKITNECQTHCQFVEMLIVSVYLWRTTYTQRQTINGEKKFDDLILAQSVNYVRYIRYLKRCESRSPCTDNAATQYYYY